MPLEDAGHHGTESSKCLHGTHTFMVTPLRVSNREDVKLQWGSYFYKMIGG